MSRLKHTAMWMVAGMVMYYPAILVAKLLPAEPHSRKDGVILLGVLMGAFSGYGAVRAEYMDDEEQQEPIRLLGGDD